MQRDIQDAEEALAAEEADREHVLQEEAEVAWQAQVDFYQRRIDERRREDEQRRERLRLEDEALEREEKRQRKKREQARMLKKLLQRF